MMQMAVWRTPDQPEGRLAMLARRSPELVERRGWNQRVFQTKSYIASAICFEGKRSFVLSSEEREIADGLNADIGADGAVVGLDIDRASETLDLATLENEGRPSVG